jgi:plasmid stabilization system protein ParE
MIDYRFLYPAEEEMIEASVFYEAASDGLGNDFLRDVKFGIDSLCEHPQLGHEVGGGLRRMLLHRFPFSLIYSVEADAILIVAVAHYGRRPGYWKDRIDN